MFRRIKNDEKGTAAIETALLFPLFILFVLGIMEFSRGFWVLHTMQLGVDQAGRWAMVNTSATDSQIISTAKSNMYGLDPAQFTVTSQSQNISGVTYKVISVSYVFNFIIPNLLPFNSVTFNRSTIVPLI